MSRHKPSKRNHLPHGHSNGDILISLIIFFVLSLIMCKNRSDFLQIESGLEPEISKSRMKAIVQNLNLGLPEAGDPSLTNRRSHPVHFRDFAEMGLELRRLVGLWLES